MARLLKLAVFFGLLLAIGYGINKFVPQQHLPWRALNPDAPLGMATKTQLLRLSLSPSKTCMNMASQISTLQSRPADPHRPNKTCGWDIARHVSQSMSIKLAPDEVDMQCPLSIASHLWMREINQIAIDEFGSPVTTIIHFGTYACRRQVGNGSGQWSEHAFANAWDIAGFELGNGRIITVKSGWNGETDERRFLRRSRKIACKVFNVTLSPDYNTAHADHFHVDMGPVKSCR